MWMDGLNKLMTDAKLYNLGFHISTPLIPFNQQIKKYDYSFDDVHSNSFIIKFCSILFPLKSLF